MKARAIAALMLAVLGATAWAAEPRGNGADAYREAFKLMDKLSPKSLEIVGAGDTTPLDRAAESAVKEGEPALAALHCGAQAGHCDWGTDYSNWLQTKLPYLGTTRQLTRMACLRARARLTKGDSRGAAEDLADAMQLANDAGSDGMPVTQLVRQGLETLVADCIAANAAGLSKADAAVILPTMNAPSSREQLKASFRREKEVLVASLPKLTEADLRTAFPGDVDWETVSQLPKHADDVARTYDRLIALLDTTSEEASNEAISMVLQYREAKNPAGELVPSIGRALQRAIDTDKAIAKARVELSKR